MIKQRKGWRGMKRRIRLKRKDGIKQHYWVGRKLRIRKNYGMAWSGKAEVPFVDAPSSYGYKKKKKMITPEEFMQLARATSTNDEWRGKPLEEYKLSTVLWHRNSRVNDRLKRLQEKRLEQIKSGLRSTEKVVPVPYVEFKEGKPRSHEGRHRAVAAEELRIKKIPVFFMYKENEAQNLG